MVKGEKIVGGVAVARSLSMEPSFYVNVLHLCMYYFLLNMVAM